MRRVQDTDGTCLFKVCEYLMPQQINSYFSHQAAKTKQQLVFDQCDVRAFEEENNFDAARKLAVSSMQLVHPEIHDLKTFVLWLHATLSSI